MQSGHVREGGQRPRPQQLRPARRQCGVQGKDILIDSVFKSVVDNLLLRICVNCIAPNCVTFFLEIILKRMFNYGTLH